MKTLLTLFGKERNELQTEIDKATNVDQVVKLVQHRLDRLEKNYIGELNVTQVRLASFFLDTLRQSIGTLAAANETEVVSPVEASGDRSAKSPNKLILKVLQALLCLGILGSLFSLTEHDPGAWTVILLTSVLVGLEVVLQLDKGNGEDRANVPQILPTERPIVRVDSNILLDNLGDALNTIDVAVVRTEPVNKQLDSSTIEEEPELLNLLQRLMGASFLGKPQMALELTKIIPQILMEQGIQAQIFRGNETPSYREYFDFEPSIDRSTKDYVTITPALLKGDRLLRRGRVIEPSNHDAKE